MHFSQTTSFSCILGRAVKSTARVQLGLNHDYKPETLQQKHLQCVNNKKENHFIEKKGLFSVNTISYLKKKSIKNILSVSRTDKS